MRQRTSGRSGVEGHCEIEGLFEAPLPDDPGFVDVLRTWERARRDEGFEFRVTVDGGRFDVHAHAVEVPAPEIGRDPVDVLSAALGELMDALGESERARAHSTLRASTFGHGTVRRTLFAVRSPGVLEVVEDRSVAETAAPQLPDPSRGPRFWAFWIALILAVSVFLVWGPGVSPFGWKDVSTVDPATLELSSAPGGVELTAVHREAGARGPWYVVLRREEAAPTSAPDPDDAGAWLAWLGAARGHGQLEWRDDSGYLLRVDPIDLDDLGVDRELMLAVPRPPERAARLRFGW